MSETEEHEDDSLHFLDIRPFWREYPFVDFSTVRLLYLSSMAKSAFDALDKNPVSDSDMEATRWSSLLAIFFNFNATHAHNWRSQSQLLVNMETRVF